MDSFVGLLTAVFFFLMQYNQRKDSLANQLKHDAEIEGSDADNRVKRVEKLTLSELEDQCNESSVSGQGVRQAGG